MEEAVNNFELVVDVLERHQGHTPLDTEGVRVPDIAAALPVSVVGEEDLCELAFHVFI